MDFFFFFFDFMTLSNLECLVLVRLIFPFSLYDNKNFEKYFLAFTINLHRLYHIIEKMIKPSWIIQFKYRSSKTRPQTDLIIRFKCTNFYRSHKLINWHVAIEDLLDIKWHTIS